LNHIRKEVFTASIVRETHLSHSRLERLLMVFCFHQISLGSKQKFLLKILFNDEKFKKEFESLSTSLRLLKKQQINFKAFLLTEYA